MFDNVFGDFGFETDLLHWGAYIDPDKTRHPESMPIYLTTVFNAEDLDELVRIRETKSFNYNRTRNPNRSALNDIMTKLEHGEASLCTSSGMAAISTALLTELKSGDHILTDKTLYGEVFDLFQQILDKFGVSYTIIDITNMAEVKRNIRPNTRIIYTESASNPMTTVCDIEKIAAFAHERGIKVFVDNTFMTPYAFRPLEHGADVVINSLTKFCNGHCDVIAGSITGSADFIEKCLYNQWVLGDGLDGMSAYLCQRGLRTLSLRMEKAFDNARNLAEALMENPHVSLVCHPSLSCHPNHEIATRQFGDRYGAMLSFDIKDGSVEVLNKFLHALRFVHYAASLGGIRTTVSVPAHSSHRMVPKEMREECGITDSLIRVSVGCENVEDLIAEFNQALDKAYQ